jgi:diguanylate cyclase (GGDEF)-like protein
MLSVTLIKRFFPRLRKSSQDEFARCLFARNNLSLVILSAFLVIEQLFYALFISTPKTPLCLCYFISSLLVALFFFVSLYFQINRPQRLLFWHKLLPPGLVFVGMAIALVRFIYIEFDASSFHVPTIYIAVLYGSAVVFVISPRLSLPLYSLMGVVAILVMPLVHLDLGGSFYLADVCANGIIAFLVSVLNYRNFVSQFANSKAIEGKNAVLIRKNQEIKLINQQLKVQSEQDVLTQLYNRRKINQLLQQLVEKYAQVNEDFSLILLDVDHFKKVNDNFGHAMGDEVLKQISQTLRDHVRESDSCGRWGGEEFIVLCPGIDCREAAPLAERLRELIGSGRSSGASVTVSIGVASFSKNSSLTQLLHTTDACLYTAKKRGRNQVIRDCGQDQIEVFFPLVRYPLT